jgi:hypothetical protein
MLFVQRLTSLDVSSRSSMSDSDHLLEPPAAARRVFVNRTLNLRAVRAVGFDMDYTLVHYRTEEWEERAYTHAKARLLEP